MACCRDIHFASKNGHVNCLRDFISNGAIINDKLPDEVGEAEE
jgi:hypothetical protein